MRSSAAFEKPEGHPREAIESLARQVGDAELFEHTRLATWPGTPGVAACVDIAEVYLETGSTERALAWLDRIPVDETFQAGKRDTLLLIAYGILGRVDEQADVAMRMFRRNRTDASLEDLIAILGEEHRDEVIAGEVEAILAEERFSITNAQFLVDLGKLDEAERYMLDRLEQINGDHYYWLAPLAKDLEDVRPLASTAAYRALLDSILGRGRSQAYGYGVHYLRKLEHMATSMEDWGPLVGHEVYAQRVREQHKRKYSFWGRYNE
ncbi:MAG: DUF6880 family protein [Coriobacteriia bacterium]